MGKTLTLPMIPVNEVTLYGVPQLVSEPSTRLVAEAPFALAVGEGYPSALTAALPRTYFASCGALMGRVEYERAEGGSSSITATFMDTPAVRVTATGEGGAEIVVFGTYEPGPDEPCGTALSALASVPFELRIQVFAWRPAGVQWDLPPQCGTQTPVLLATSSTPKLAARLANIDGQPFYAQNAAPDRQLTVTLEAEGAHTWFLPSAEAGLAELRWPDVASTVSVNPTIGAPLAVTVVEASAVTAAQVEFVLGGHVGNSIPLEDGASLGADGWRRTSNRIVPIIGRTNVGANVLCSQPDPTWFELLSDTTSSCDVRPVTQGPLEGAVILPGPHLGASSYVRADGACKLRLRASAFDGGKGFEQRLSVTLQNVSELFPIE